MKCNIHLNFNFIFKEEEKVPHSLGHPETYYVVKDNLRFIIQQYSMNSNKTNDTQQSGLDKEQNQLHNIYIILYFKSP